MKKYLYAFAMLLCIFAFRLSENDLFFIPPNWANPEYDFSKNPLSAEKVLLGRVLFYDPILSRNNTIACANCHSQYNAFTHADHALSHGIEDKIGTRNSPTLMNLAWQKKFMWDGAVHHLDVQSLTPIHNPLEMDERIEHVVQKLQKSAIYPALYKQAYGDTLITGERTLKAMAQFMLTLISANSKYDKVMNGAATFTPQEKNGYELFKKNCASCHQEPLFTRNDFANNGLKIDSSLHDIGRMGITQNPKDSLFFKIPSLRNIEFSYPYMHDGRFKTLTQVMNHYTKGIVAHSTLSPELEKPILLTSHEKVDLIAFLLTLTDKEFLFNPLFSYPKTILLPH